MNPILDKIRAEKEKTINQAPAATSVEHDYKPKTEYRFSVSNDNYDLKSALNKDPVYAGKKIVNVGTSEKGEALFKLAKDIDKNNGYVIASDVGYRHRYVMLGCILRIMLDEDKELAKKLFDDYGIVVRNA